MSSEPSTGEERRPRVAVVHHGYVPTYRVRFYERLAREGSFEYVVFHGPPPGGRGDVAAHGPFAFPNVRVANHELRLGPKRLVYQALVREVLFGGYDAVVLGAWLRFASTLVLHPALIALGRPVILWGQGAGKDEDVGRAGRLLLSANERLRGRIARTAGAYLVYTAGGAERLMAAGVRAERIFVVRNTLDMDEQVALHAELQRADAASLRAELGVPPDSAVLLYVGRIYREKRLGELLAAVRLARAEGLAQRSLEVVVIGDGPDLPAARRAAEGLAGVRFLGELRDQRELARWMRIAAAVVIPGAVGLAVNHAFGQGRPLVTRASRLHGPEIEYVEDGVNGVIVPGGLPAFARALAALADDDGRQRALAAGALRSREALTLDAMVAAFDAGVAAALASSRYSSDTGWPRRSARASASVARDDAR